MNSNLTTPPAFVLLTWSRCSHQVEGLEERLTKRFVLCDPRVNFNCLDKIMISASLYVHLI